MVDARLSRKHERIDTILAARVRLDPLRTYDVAVENLSSGGAFLAVERIQFDVGSQITLTIMRNPVDPSPVELRASVVWYCAGKGATGYGIAFDDNADAIALLESLQRTI